MATKTMKVGYHLVRNATATADKAPYLGVAVPIGSLAYDNILARMLDRGTHMTRATAQYFLNAFYEYAAETIAEDVVRINMGAVSIYPMIGGSFDSEDDEFRAPRNTLYVGATLSQEIRDAVSGLTPTNLGAGPANGTVKITSVMDLASEEYDLIDGLNEFRIVGIDLTVPDGEDESLSLVAADGTTKASDITVVSTEDGQRIVCTLASAVPAGTYHVRLVSHGLDPTAPLSTVLYRVTVKAGAPVTPAPTLTSGYSENHDNNPGVMFADGAWIQSGTNLQNGAWTIGYIDKTSGDAETVEVDPEAVTTAQDGTSATIVPGVLVTAIENTVMGGTITVTVTTAGGSATFNAESAGS